MRVQFPDWSTAEAVGAAQLGPRLDRLQADGAVAGWWFLRKHPCWRLRLHGADTAAVNHALDELTAAGAIGRWWSTIYEPEIAAFGGPAGMAATHDVFCADTLGVLGYLRHQAPGLGRRELSIVLLSGLLRAAGLDTFAYRPPVRASSPMQQRRPSCHGADHDPNDAGRHRPPFHSSA